MSKKIESNGRKTILLEDQADIDMVNGEN